MTIQKIIIKKIKINIKKNKNLKYTINNREDNNNNNITKKEENATNNNDIFNGKNENICKTKNKDLNKIHPFLTLQEQILIFGTYSKF